MIKEEDFIHEGFERLDANIMAKRPPKIKWGNKYEKMNMNEQKVYLEKIAFTMNHAAYLIQNERNLLNELMIKKEAQLVALTESNQQIQMTLQSEMIRMNAERQQFNEAVVKLNARIKELK